jgi:tRNA A-37 threonylcarbamoyl transferase component Bud32
MKNYVRRCPVCGTEAAPDATQCAGCGTLLLGVDLTLKDAAPAASGAPAAPAPENPRCPHDDCGAENPPGSTSCLYCGRPFAPEAAAKVGAGGTATLFRLPTALAARFDIAEVLPAGGAEAEIMVLTGRETGVKVIAKLYRPGLLPKGEVIERVSRAAFRHVVRLIAWGESDGIGYEVMEYCPAGSLRGLMAAGPLPGDVRRAILVELSDALADLHALDVIHRDLKPENILVRWRKPLDLVLTDFGIASVAAATQVFTGLARTVRYGAPETLTGVLDRAADWWSLGMIVAELAGGRHPYDGLSDAVVTHRLVTGEVDLAAVEDRDWRKLCRGLLQRDPRQRWGAAEVRRWLDGDATLAEPAATVTTTSVHIPRPYRVMDIACTTPAELAVALATHWEAGRKDLARGQLADWFERELRDDNLLRLARDLAELRGVSDDLRLLRLIRALAPEMPPVWRGASLLVANLVAQAARAGQGDAAATEWLLSALAQDALGELPATRFPEEAALAARWAEARARVAALWRDAETQRTHWRKEQTSRDGVADFDALVFGQPSASAPPAPARLYPPLLLALADATYAAALRARVEAEAAPWRADNPWLEPLLAEAGAGPAELMVALFLLPHAREATEDARKRAARAAAAVAAAHAGIARRANTALALLREASDLGLTASALEREAARAAARELLALAEEARAAGLAPDSPPARALRRAEPIALRIQERLDTWTHAARINALLKNRNLGQGVLIGIPGMLFFFGAQFLAALPWALGALGAFALWRVWELARLRGAIRQLAQGLPSRVSAS